MQYLSTSNDSGPFAKKGTGLQKLADLIKIVFNKEQTSASYMEFVAQCFKVHVNTEEKKKLNPKNEGWGAAQKTNSLTTKTPKTISYWCFNPGFGLVLSIIELDTLFIPICS